MNRAANANISRTATVRSVRSRWAIRSISANSGLGRRAVSIRLSLGGVGTGTRYHDITCDDCGRILGMTVKIVDGKLPCNICKQWLPIAQFGVNRARKCGYMAYCRACCSKKNYTRRTENLEEHRGYLTEWRKKNKEHVTAYYRRRDLMKKYGLTEDDYAELLAAQDGKCAVCRTPDPGNGRYTRFLVDHDHETGKVRALLCNPCNVAIGQVQDNPERLLALARYLLSFQDVLGAEHAA